MAFQEPVVKTGDTELLFRTLKNPNDHPRYDGSEHFVKTLPKGFQRTPENRKFSEPTIYEKDVQISMRDGIILRADIFRPAGSDPVPALLPWSPYGKSGRGQSALANVVIVTSVDDSIGIRLTDMPGGMGIPMANLSGFEKFEGPDPAEWVPRGYAVINIDSRGSWDSQGYLWYVYSCFHGAFLTGTAGLEGRKAVTDTML